MPAKPRITRLTLIPASGPNDEIRRYRLARLDEIALAWPPDRSAGSSAGAPGDEGDAVARQTREAARRRPSRLA